MHRLWKVLIGLAATGIIACLGFFFFMMYQFGEFNRVFPAHDPKFLGDWWALSGGEVLQYRFLESGKGLRYVDNRGPEHFTWGTDDGKLQVMYMATDYWSNPIFPVTFLEDGQHLKLQGARRLGRFVSDMFRDRSLAMQHDLDPERAAWKKAETHGSK